MMENTVKYLWKAASLLSTSDRVHLKIRSNLLNNALTSAQYKYKFNIGATGPHVRCQHCHTEWKHNKYSHKILKNKKLPKRSKRRYKLIAKNIIKARNENQLNKAKERLCGKVVLIKCSVCDLTTKQIITKDSRTRQNINNTLTTNQSSNGSLKKTPQKKSLQSQSKENTIQSKSKKRKLQELCYQTSATKTINSSASNQNTSSNSATNTPVKKKRQRDKFAGLFRDACIASSTPKQKSDLQKLLKARDSK